GSGTGEGTGSKPGVPDVPSDDSKEELSWKSSEDENIDSKKESDDEEDQESKLSKEARIQEEEDADELQANQFADVVSAILGIVHQYMDQQMKEAVREAAQIQTDRL
nr:hypothetical protein [Tanacetum cinerariifolium]